MITVIGSAAAEATDADATDADAGPTDADPSRPTDAHCSSRSHLLMLLIQSLLLIPLEFHWNSMKLCIHNWITTFQTIETKIHRFHSPFVPNALSHFVPLCWNRPDLSDFVTKFLYVNLII